mmetsp:Transcript_7986/g.17147  ORF Transcript_7986/g.17147 Transcript_7986/m.17147 type:complete len:226 (+) Transcript_7986:1081-1758(+)
MDLEKDLAERHELVAEKLGEQLVFTAVQFNLEHINLASFVTKIVHYGLQWFPGNVPRLVLHIRWRRRRLVVGVDRKDITLWQTLMKRRLERVAFIKSNAVQQTRLLRFQRFATNQIRVAHPFSHRTIISDALLKARPLLLEIPPIKLNRIPALTNKLWTLIRTSLPNHFNSLGPLVLALTIKPIAFLQRSGTLTRRPSWTGAEGHNVSNSTRRERHVSQQSANYE